MPSAVNILKLAADLVGGSRAAQHGDKARTFDNIATLWNAWLAIRIEPAAPLTGYDVAQMMSLMKKARTQTGALNADDYVDDAGYSGLAGELSDRQSPIAQERLNQTIPIVPAAPESLSSLPKTG